MAGIEHLVATDQLKTGLLMSIEKGQQARQQYYTYEPVFDAFIMLVVPPETDTVAHYVDDQVALLYRADDYEIVGIQVEAFQKRFVPKHANVERVWRLSDSGTKLNNMGDLIFAVKHEERRLAEEVLKAANNVLGVPGRELAEALDLEPA